MILKVAIAAASPIGRFHREYFIKIIYLLDPNFSISAIIYLKLLDKYSYKPKKLIKTHSPEPPLQLKGLTKQERRLISKECIRLTGVNNTIVEEAIRTATVPQNDEVYKKYLVCSYKRQGFQAEDGTMLYDNVATFLLQFYSYRDVQFALGSCRRIGEQGSPEENAFKALECILQNLKALDENSV